MAKVIKCPRCGSLDKQQIDVNQFRCEHCGTTYLEDISSIFNEHKEGSRPNDQLQEKRPNSNRRKYIGFVGVILAIWVIVVIFSATNKKAPVQKVRSVPAPTVKPQVNIKTNQHVDNKSIKPVVLDYSRSTKITYPFVAVDSKAYSFTLESRSFLRDKDLNGLYYEIRDIESGELLKSKRLFSGSVDVTKSWFVARFADNMTYIAGNGSNLFLFDEQNFSVADITSTLQHEYSELSSGIAVVNLASEIYGDALYILTNDGYEYLIYPQTKKVIPLIKGQTTAQRLNEINQLNRSDSTQLNSNQIYRHTIFCFANLSNQNSLIKIVYDDDKQQDLSFHTCPVKASNEPNEPYKVVYRPYKGQIIEDKILAPERIFIDPEVIYGNDKQLIIKSKSTASPKAFFNLQSLDPDTGEMRWMVNGSKDIDLKWLYLAQKEKLGKYGSVLLPYGDRYIVQLSAINYLIISATGEAKLVNYAKQEITREK